MRDHRQNLIIKFKRVILRLSHHVSGGRHPISDRDHLSLCQIWGVNFIGSRETGQLVHHVRGSLKPGQCAVVLDIRRAVDPVVEQRSNLVDVKHIVLRQVDHQTELPPIRCLHCGTGSEGVASAAVELGAESGLPRSQRDFGLRCESENRLRQLHQTQFQRSGVR